MKWPWKRTHPEVQSDPPSYWKPASRVALVWEWPEDGEATFHVEAPTAEEAEGWARAAHNTGIHGRVNAATPSHQPRVQDPLS